MKIVSKILALTFSLFYLALPLGVLATNTYSLSLNGTSQYSTAADSPSLSITTDFTGEAWVNFSSLTFNNEQAIIFIKTSTVDDAYDFVIGDDGSPFRVFLAYWDTGVYRVIQKTGLTFKTGVWYHIAITADISAGTGNIFINDTKYTGSSVGAGTTIRDSDGLFTVGAGVGGWGRFFPGLLDEVRIWNDIRTDAEITDNYRTELVENEQGPVAYYRFNNSALDETANDNDLTLVNSPTYSTDVPFSGGGAVEGEENYYVE